MSEQKKKIERKERLKNAKKVERRFCKKSVKAVTNNTKKIRYEDIKVGNRASFKKKITEEDVEKFANLIGDFSPIHMDEEFAKVTHFGGRIVHGMLVASLFSTLIGMYIPGKRGFYLSQEAIFKKPVKLGDEIAIVGEVERKFDSIKVLVIKTQALNVKGEVVVDGKAKVMILEEKQNV